jgi:hypothetical protein
MIIQLPSGKIIECSLEIYLQLSDAEYNELNGLGVQYTRDESNNPFYNSFSNELRLSKAQFIEDLDEEYEPNLYELDSEQKRSELDIPNDID